MAGAYDIVVAAGVEVMSLVPMGASIGKGLRLPLRPSGMNARYEDKGGLVPQGISAEMIADKWDLSREDLDAFAAESQQRAARPATRVASTTRSSRSRSSARDKETGDLIESDEMVTTDEGIRDGTTVESAGQAEAGLQARRQGHRRQLARRSPTVPRPC